jgi:hypothetical protein
MIPLDSIWPAAGENAERTRSALMDGRNRREVVAMGVALGWVAFALAGVAAAPHPGPQTEQITYTVRYVEAEGLGWRGAVFTRLKPVCRQAAATVWTVPQDATTRLLKQVTKNPAGTILQAPKVTAFSGAAASIHSRSNRKLVTQVAWKGDDQAPEAATEDVRVGWHTTMVGRKLDQGILVQIVLEDTQIRAVHQLNFPGSGEPKCSAAQTSTVVESPVVFKGTGKAAGTYAHTYQWNVKKSQVNEEKCNGQETCCQMEKDQDVHKVSVDVPEIGSQEVAGEWLIPHGEYLLVSFGAYTVADKDGKAIVKERLAIIGAEQAPLANAVPHANAVPTASPTPLPASIYNTAPIPAPPPIAKLPLPVPVVPSRSFPQGIHADGKPADLPKLPDDEADDTSSESSEPMPSPQTKKPPVQAKPKPTTDGGTAKAGYVLPRGPSLSFSSFLPTSATGMQFLMPIKPFTLKLPFNQKLQIEILGRVVADTETP